MIKSAMRYFDYQYYLRFAGLFLFFYCSYTFVNAVSVPTGTYYPFVEKYLNFPVLIRYAVLNTSQLLLSLFGYNTIVNGPQLTSNEGLIVLEMAWACYGLGLKSFWVAFVCAHQMTLKQKIAWSVVGVFVIFLLNCFRVTLMMIAMAENWKIVDSLNTNAHDFFNYLCYAAILGLILVFYKKAEPFKKKRAPVAPSL
jgi:exosortase/archaeosortase family protein